MDRSNWASVAPGSYLAISHGSHGGRSDLAQPLAELYRHTATQLTARSALEIQALLDGFDPVPRGVVFLPWWRPDSPADVDARPERFSTYAVVGRQDDLR